MDIFATMQISASALKAQRIRMNAISSNLANIETTRTPDGGPYRKREVVFQSSTEGFANTLAVGIASSMFSALFVVKLMYDAALSGKNPKLSIGWRKK